VTFDLILLAPACDYILFGKVLERHARRIHHLRIFALQDQVEMASPFIPGFPVYPYSLLYFACGVLEKEADHPLLGLQRFVRIPDPYQDMPVIQAVVTRLNPARDFVWAPYDGGAGLQSSALNHGDFFNKYADPQAVASLKHLIRQGF
jgi:hypothetical protein